MAKGKPLTETEVAAILQSEIHSSLGYIGSDITNQRQKSVFSDATAWPDQRQSPALRLWTLVFSN